MVTPQLFNGATIAVYKGAVAATPTAITPATGAIMPDASVWDQQGLGPWNNGVTWQMQDERTGLMTQGSLGRPIQRRRTLQGFMMTIPSFNMTPQFYDLAWGSGITTTPPASGQVGIHRIPLDLPLVVPAHGILIVVDSPFDDAGTRPYKGLFYLASAAVSIGETPMGVDAPDAGVEMVIEQNDHATASYMEMVFAPAT